MSGGSFHRCHPSPEHGSQGSGRQYEKDQKLKQIFMIACRFGDHQLPDEQRRQGGDDGGRAGFFQNSDTEGPEG